MSTHHTQGSIQPPKPNITILPFQNHHTALTVMVFAAQAIKVTIIEVRKKSLACFSPPLFHFHKDCKPDVLVIFLKIGLVCFSG
jgi:hypothetical protein